MKEYGRNQKQKGNMVAAHSLQASTVNSNRRQAEQSNAWRLAIVKARKQKVSTEKHSSIAKTLV